MRGSIEGLTYTRLCVMVHSDSRQSDKGLKELRSPQLNLQLEAAAKCFVLVVWQVGAAGRAVGVCGGGGARGGG